MYQVYDMYDDIYSYEYVTKLLDEKSYPFNTDYTTVVPTGTCSSIGNTGLHLTAIVIHQVYALQ